MGEGIVLQNGSRKTGRTSTLERPRQTVDLDSRKFRSAVSRAQRQTDNNDHGGASVTMAKAFGYNDIADKLNKVNKEHAKVGYLRNDLFERRNKLESELEERIEKNYGARGLDAWIKGKS